MTKILGITTTENCGWCPHREEFFDRKSKMEIITREVKIIMKDIKSKLSLEQRVKRLEELLAKLIIEIHYNDLVKDEVIRKEGGRWK